MYINLSGKCKLAFVVCLLKITQINATLAFGSNKSFQFFSVYLIPVKLLHLDKMSSTEINMYLECALEYNVRYIIICFSSILSLLVSILDNLHADAPYFPYFMWKRDVCKLPLCSSILLFLQNSCTVFVLVA